LTLSSNLAGEGAREYAAAQEEAAADHVFGVPIFMFDGDKLNCERIYFDQATVRRQLGIGRDPLSLTGRLQTLVGHPWTIGRGVVRQLTGR